jgi:hypothetical protein
MEIIQYTFEKLSKATSINDVNNILKDLEVDKKHQMDDEMYPPINFRITKNEIKELIKKGLLTEEYFVKDVSNQNVLTKLLYSVAWKNGDIKKIRHIIEGIMSEDDSEKESALVFYQFGKYLTKRPGEPIIDQHVLRAFGIHKALNNQDEHEIQRLTTLSVMTKKEKELIDDYKNWLKNDLKDELRKHDDYAYYVDKVLFAVGKKIKKENTKRGVKIFFEER